MKLGSYFFIFLFLSTWACKSDTTNTTSVNDTTSESSVEQSTAEVATQNPISSAEKSVTVPQGHGLSISGKVSNLGNHPVSISKVGYIQTKPVVLAQGKMDADGNFALHINPQKKGVYSLKIGNIQTNFLLEGDEKAVTISTTDKGFQAFDFEFKGAPINKSYMAMMKGAATKSFTLDQIKAKILGEKDPLVASLAALQILKDPAFTSIHKKIYAKLAKDNQIDKALYVGGYQKIITSMETFSKQNNPSSSAGGISVGMKAPELAYPDPTGKVRKLSDLKGQLVLLDFWASWCGPCRRANPKVVSIYNKYKDKGFTVFSVSLDGNKRDFSEAAKAKGREKWIKAIEKDGLVWEHHVSDLKSWSSEASAKYGVRSIPATFLIGRDGKIVELEPGRKDLEALIKKHL